MRTAAQELRELIRKNTLGQHNKCEFDKTIREKKLESSPLRKNANP